MKSTIISWDGSYAKTQINLHINSPISFHWVLCWGYIANWGSKASSWKQQDCFLWLAAHVIFATVWQNQIQEWRLRSTCTDAQSDQSLRFALDGLLRTQCFFMRTAKTQIRLDRCPRLSWVFNGLQVILLVSSCSGSILIIPDYFCRTLQAMSAMSQWRGCTTEEQQRVSCVTISLTGAALIE